MGFRLSIKIKGTNKWFGDDHKLYGYVPYEMVRNSFNRLYFYMLAQWKNDFTFFEESEKPEKEFYDTFCRIGCTPKLEIDADTFKIFAKDYIEEFKNRETMHLREPDDDFVNEISEYMKKLADDPRHKILIWT